MRQLFQGLLALFGVIVVGISLAHMAIGPRAIVGSVAVNPTMAGEDRFFAGGIGRLLAVVIDGAPHPFYLAMLAIELVAPPLMVVVAKRVAKPTSG
jgi:hypothetical protein